MKIQIDTYYDLTCDGCCKSWSTDFNYRNGHMDDDGGMAESKSLLQKQAYKAGWGCRGGKTLCPDCLKAFKEKQSNA